MALINKAAGLYGFYKKAKAENKETAYQDYLKNAKIEDIEYAKKKRPLEEAQMDFDLKKLRLEGDTLADEYKTKILKGQLEVDELQRKKAYAEAIIANPEVYPVGSDLWKEAQQNKMAIQKIEREYELRGNLQAQEGRQRMAEITAKAATKAAAKTQLEKDTRTALEKNAKAYASLYPENQRAEAEKRFFEGAQKDKDIETWTSLAKYYIDAENEVEANKMMELIKNKLAENAKNRMIVTPAPVGGGLPGADESVSFDEYLRRKRTTAGE